jgi:hypothetical protein
VCVRDQQWAMEDSMANKARIDTTSPVKLQHEKRWRLKQIEEDTLRRLAIIAHYSYSANTCATAKKKIEELQSVIMPRVHCWRLIPLIQVPLYVVSEAGRA